MKKILAACCMAMITASLFAGGRSDAEKGTAAKKEKEFKPAYKPMLPEGEPCSFNEVWGWVMKERESEFDVNYPLTDVCYFSAEVDSYGELCEIPDIKLLGNFAGRKHIVVVCDSKSLTHFVVDPAFGLRDKMVQDIMTAATPYDGVQVDYELIPGKDAKNFLNFLTLLSEECKKANKMFTVCVPARMKTISDDVFPYKKIAEISDRVMIMAYDEHWSTSKPGAIANEGWCERICNYAKTVIPQEKLIMGLPFYGRTWASEKTASGWYFTGVNRLMREHSHEHVQYLNGIPNVKMTFKVDVEAWWEDCYSTVQKMRMYESKDVSGIAFWRIGQEDPIVWKWVSVVPKVEEELEVETDTSVEYAEK